MKKIIYFIIMFISIISGTSYIARANDFSEQGQFTNLFLGLDENKLVVVYPDGSISYTDDTANDYSENFLREEQAQILPVSEAKMKVSEILSKPRREKRQATPNWEPRMLIAGEHYRSQRFSGHGWRFSGYSFYPKLGTGAYLYFRSIGDDGRIGTYNDAQNTNVLGKITGTALLESEGWKAFWVGDFRTNANNALGYYTYNPKANTVYEVHN